MTQQPQMKAFASAQDVIALTEGWRNKLKEFMGQEDKIRYLTEERNRFRDMAGDLRMANDSHNDALWRLERKEKELTGEISLLRHMMDKNRTTANETVKEEPKRFSFKRILVGAAVLAPYALIGSYVASLYI